MVDVVRRRRSRGRAAERHQPLGDAAAQYASMGWPVCIGERPYRGTRTAMEPGRGCSCDRMGCPAPGAHPVSPAWQMQATVDLNVIQSWWETRPEANVILVTGRVFDVLDEPESVVRGLRWHCRDSYVLAPPSRYAPGLAARWLRPPQEHPLPDAVRLLEYLVDACE